MGTYPGRKLEWEFHQILSLVGGLTLNIRVSDGVVVDDAFREKINEIFEKFVTAMETSALADDGLQIKHLGPLWGGPARPTRETPVPPSKQWVPNGAAGGKKGGMKLGQNVRKFKDGDPNLSAKDASGAERALLGRSKGGKKSLGQSVTHTEKRVEAWRKNGEARKGKKRGPQVKNWDLQLSEEDYIHLADEATQFLGSSPDYGWPEVAEKFIDLLAARFPKRDFDPFLPVNRDNIYRDDKNSKFVRIILGLQTRRKTRLKNKKQKTKD